MEECMEPEGRIPEWLAERRAERGFIGPMPSRDWGDNTVNPLTKDVAFNRHSMNDGHHVSPADNGKVQVGTDGIQVVLAQGIDEEQLKKTLTAATRATIGMDLSQTLPGDWEACDQFRIWALSQPDFPEKIEQPEFMDGFKAWTDCEHSNHKYKTQWGSDDSTLFEGQVSYPDWEEMLKGGLQTALETQVIVFAVSGVSRTGTHQLVRSRKAAFHQQSQRAGYMGDAPEFRMPESMWVNERVRKAFLKLTIESWKTYQIACEEDIAYQDARFALLEGSTNFILLEYSIREFLNVYAYRACSMFQWEIVDVMRKCREVLIAAHPWMEPYVKISCEKTGPAVISRNIPTREAMEEDLPSEVTVPHHCTFQGWEDVEGQCDFSWAKHEARTFKPEFHRISRRTVEVKPRESGKSEFKSEHPAVDPTKLGKFGGAVPRMRPEDLPPAGSDDGVADEGTERS